MPVYLKPAGEQEVGDDITGSSDAIVMASAPDVALPKETKPAAVGGVSLDQVKMRPAEKQPQPVAAIVAAGAAGLLVGVVLKKSLPALKGRC